MAFNKNKIIALAQKYVQKGQLDRAIKEYIKVLEVDSKDIRTRLKVGDLYAKKGDIKEAVQIYQEAAESYSKDGFYLKAVAVYKNILKLAPNMIEINLKLGDLYHQLSLLVDAMGQYQIVVSHYEKSGMVKEALDTLKKMVELDPENLTFKINLAELYYKEGHGPQAMKEFDNIAADLKANEKDEDLVKIYERILHHQPDRLEVHKDLAKIYIKMGQPQKALAKLQICFKASPKDIETLEALAQSFMLLKQPNKAKSVYKELVALYEQKGDAPNKTRMQQEIRKISPEDAAEEPAPPQKLAPPPSFTSSPPMEAPAPPDEEVTEFSLHSGGSPLDPVIPASSPPPTVGAVDLGAADAEDELDDVDADITRLMTETEVYLKYGLNDKAKEHLEVILAKRPNHYEARVKLKDFLLAAQDKAHAVVQLKELIRISADKGNAAAQKAHMDELSKLDSSASPAETATAAEPVEIETSAPSDVEILADMPMDLTESVDIQEPQVENAGASDSGITLDNATEISLESEPMQNLGSSEMEISVEPAGSMDLGDLGIEVEVDLDSSSPNLTMEEPVAEPEPAEIEEALITEAPPPPPRPVAPPRVAPVLKAEPEKFEMPLEVREGLDEAEFFVQQGLRDEAQSIYDDLNERFGKSKEIAKLLKEKMAAMKHLPHMSTPAAASHSHSQPELSNFEEFAASVSMKEEASPAVQETVADEEPLFDLAAELNEDLQEYATPDVSSASAPDEQVDFKEVFEQFKKGVAKQLSKEDVETHFDLGLAYKEMQLIDDAINEFQVAMSDQKRVVECYTMIGLCFMDKADYLKAADYFRQGLAWKTISTPEVIGLNYELGCALMNAGKSSEALDVFGRVYKLDASFRDTIKKMEELEDLDDLEGAENKPSKKSTAAAKSHEDFDLGQALKDEVDGFETPLETSRPTAKSRKPAPVREPELTGQDAFDTPSEKSPRRDSGSEVQSLKKTEPGHSERPKTKSKISYV